MTRETHCSDESLAERVLRFVSEQAGYPRQRVSPSTRLSRDIGLAGDDAVEFFEAFAKEFSIDRVSLSRLDLRAHFGDEGMPLEGCVLFPVLLLRPAWDAVRGRRGGEDQQSIRVEDLIQAAAAGRWLLPDPSSQR